MTHVVTQSCCNDAACVAVCPVDCIHPRPGTAGFGAAEMLAIDPDVCIDCGACTDVCPVSAIVPDTELTAATLPFLEINRLYTRLAPEPTTRRETVAKRSRELHVAVIGTGPAGIYAVEELLARGGSGVRISLIDRLAVAGGLARFGVAPDHTRTRGFLDRFAALAQDPRVTLHLNVEVGRHLSLDEVRAAHHAVVLAVGADGDRRLGIPGENVPGCWSAREFVAWYNGHPDHAGRHFDLGCERAVVIGNGNVALDVARILTADPGRLARTDISDHALAALRRSAVREIVVLGRRGPAEAAFTVPELVGLAGLEEVAVTAAGLRPDDAAADQASAVKLRLVRALAGRDAPRRIELRFRATPVEVLGDNTVRGIRLATDDGTLDLDCGLVLRSVGYRCRPFPGLPFDDASGVVPNDAGRVEPGLYVTGWIKRGPSGGIGANRDCAAETVTSLLAENLPAPRADSFAELVGARQPERIGLAGWLAIERNEVHAGYRTDRQRRKLLSAPRMVQVALERPS